MHIVVSGSCIGSAGVPDDFISPSPYTNPPRRPSAGVTAECPPSAPMVDGTECQEHGGRCQAGKCVPFCELNGLHSCMCDVEKYACNLCCRKSLNDTCTAQEPLRTLSGGTPCMHGLCTNSVSRGRGRGEMRQTPSLGTGEGVETETVWTSVGARF